MDGFNSTILAYGQTGSGKTFTIGTGQAAVSDDAQLGIIPRVARGLFAAIAAKQRLCPGAQFSVRCCFLEIYGDEIRDLLNVGGKPLEIREFSSCANSNAAGNVGAGGVGVPDATARTVGSAAEIVAVLEEGALCRQTGTTVRL
jgi:kinesin family protein 4/21/27